MLYNGSQNNQQQYFQQPNIQQMTQMRQPNVPSQRGTIDVIVTIDNNSTVNNYPVSPNTTVMFVNFNTKEFFIKTVDNFSRQYPIQAYTFTEKEDPVNNQQMNFQNDLGYREEIDNKINNLSQSVKDMYKMLEDLTAPSEKIKKGS